MAVGSLFWMMGVKTNNIVHPTKTRLMAHTPILCAGLTFLGSERMRVDNAMYIGMYPTSQKKSAHDGYGNSCLIRTAMAHHNSAIVHIAQPMVKPVQSNRLWLPTVICRHSLNAKSVRPSAKGITIKVFRLITN